MNKLSVVGISLSLFSFVSCVKVPEMTLAEIYNYNPETIVSPKKKVGF